MTASTRTVTLSLVMMSWGGTFMVIVWRLTFTMRSMPNGMISTNPGPFARPRTRPSRKTTPRSYSWTILMADRTRISASSTMMPMTMRLVISTPFLLLLDEEQESVHPPHPDLPARGDGPVEGPSLPEGSLDVHLAFGRQVGP